MTPCNKNAPNRANGFCGQSRSPGNTTLRGASQCSTYTLNRANEFGGRDGFHSQPTGPGTPALQAARDSGPQLDNGLDKVTHMLSARLQAMQPC